jgi:hypothetical protein
MPLHPAAAASASCQLMYELLESYGSLSYLTRPVAILGPFWMGLITMFGAGGVAGAIAAFARNTVATFVTEARAAGVDLAAFTAVSLLAALGLSFKGAYWAQLSSPPVCVHTRFWIILIVCWARSQSRTGDRLSVNLVATKHHQIVPKQYGTYAHTNQSDSNDSDNQ